MELQITELITRFGDVVLIWFDGLGQETMAGVFKTGFIDSTSATLINNRIGLPRDAATVYPKFIPTTKAPHWNR